jgi:hypothetical protein
VRTNQQSADWLTAALNGFQIREEVKLKATDTKLLHKPVKMTPRIREKVSSGPDELLQWIKNLNPGLHLENWQVLNSKNELTGWRLILLVALDYATAIKRLGNKILRACLRAFLKSSAFPKQDQDCGGGSWVVRAVGTKARGKGTGDSTSSETQRSSLGRDLQRQRPLVH